MEASRFDSDETVDDRISIVDSVWVKMYPTFNGIASVAELASGVVSGNIGVAVDGMHGTAEVVIANTQINHAHEHDHIEDHQRKMIYAALSGLAGAAGALAIAEATGVIEWGSDNRLADAVSWLSAGAAAVSAWSASSALLHRIHHKYGRLFKAPLTETEHDVKRHIVLLDTPSSTLAFMSASARLASLWLTSKGYNGMDTEMIEHYIGAASGAWGAYLFRPTEANLEHHSERTSHETLPPVIEEMESTRNFRSRLFKKLRNGHTPSKIEE